MRTCAAPAPSGAWVVDQRARRRRCAAPAASSPADDSSRCDAYGLELLLGRPQPLDHVLRPGRHVVVRRLEDLGQPVDEVALAGQVAEALQPDERLDPAVARADRRDRHQHHGADLRRPLDVGAAAQLARPRPADLDHPDQVGVALAEQRHRAHVAAPAAAA